MPRTGRLCRPSHSQPYLHRPASEACVPLAIFASCSTRDSADQGNARCSRNADDPISPDCPFGARRPCGSGQRPGCQEDVFGATGSCVPGPGCRTSQRRAPHLVKLIRNRGLPFVSAPLNAWPECPHHRAEPGQRLGLPRRHQTRITAISHCKERTVLTANLGHKCAYRNAHQHGRSPSDPDRTAAARRAAFRTRSLLRSSRCLWVSPRVPLVWATHLSWLMDFGRCASHAGCCDCLIAIY
jgi:hypothetical protein